MKCKENVKFTNGVNESNFDKFGGYSSYQKQCINNLNLRTHVKKEKILIAGLNNVTRSKHIHGLDLYDKSRQLSAINKIQLTPKYVVTWYAIIDDKKVLLSKLIKRLQHNHTKYIVDTKINKKIYVDGNIYNLEYTTAR